MNLFYHPHLKPSDSEIIFDKDESRHISKVLRKKEGDVLHITNGSGDLFTAQLKDTSPRQCLAMVVAVQKADPLPYRLHLAVAPTKNNDRYEWFLEKATEIGIHTITPLFCDRSERRVIKPERLERIIESAMKQSLKTHKPILAPAISFPDFIKQLDHLKGIKCLAHCEEAPKQSLVSLIEPNRDVVIMIGPEGDFTPKEIALAAKKGVVQVSLGDSRLRTETAAIVACHTVAIKNQLH